MFYLGNQRCTKDEGDVDGDEFGWWLVQEPEADLSASNFSNVPKGARSTGSSSSMMSCLDTMDDGDTFALAEDFTPKQGNAEGGEQMELTSLSPEYNVSVGSGEGEPDHRRYRSTAKMDSGDVPPGEESLHKASAVSYTPERLIRAQEYRILIPSPRCLSVPHTTSSTPIATPRKSHANNHHHHHRLNCLIDSKQVGASQLEALLDPGALEIKLPAVSRRKLNLRRQLIKTEPGSRDPLAIVERGSPLRLQTPDLVSSRTSFERLNTSWEDCTEEPLRTSQEDTSGIQSNETYSESPSESRTPLRLCDELSQAANLFYPTNVSKVTAINEVVSILEGLQTNPTRATALLAEDRFLDGCSGHDQLARLALAIESDGNVPGVPGDPEHVVRQLRGKVQRLQEANRDIYRDICNLRSDFQHDEKRVSYLTSDATRLGREVHEMRYLDDLVNLLQGELARISSRNWPFNLGHSDHQAEEINLVV